MKDLCTSAFRANLFTKVTNLICRLPVPTIIRYTKGYTPRRPDTILSTIQHISFLKPSLYHFLYKISIIFPKPNPVTN